MPGVKNIGFVTLWSCDGRVCIRVWPQRVDALRVSRSFVVSSICIYTVRFSVIIKEGLRKCETLKNKTRLCGMKMIILGGGCFEPSLIQLPTWIESESTLQTLKNKYFKETCQRYWNVTSLVNRLWRHGRFMFADEKV